MPSFRRNDAEFRGFLPGITAEYRQIPRNLDLIHDAEIHINLRGSVMDPLRSEIFPVKDPISHPLITKTKRGNKILSMLFLHPFILFMSPWSCICMVIVDGHKCTVHCHERSWSCTNMVKKVIYVQVHESTLP